MEQQKASVMDRKWFLYVTGFFSGMSVMAIELGASRLLAPYFSSSQIVWTVIIGTIMIALAAGNVWGGRSADRNPDPARLYGRLLLAAVWTAAVPLLGRYVIAGLTALLALFVTRNFLVWASFASCIVLFVFPLMLLGTVTPSLIKYAARSLDDNGRTVGELEALGTLGSILGTFLPTFVTIPAVGTARTFLIFAGILAVISLIYFISRRRKIARGAVCVLLIAGLACAPFSYSFAFWEKGLAYEGESIYNYLQVKETDASVILSTNVAVGVQSIKMKSGGLTGMYYDYALAAPMMAGGAEDILILGLGSGTYAAQCETYYPGCHVTGVEIDRKIIDLSRTYFDLPSDVEAVCYDGRAYLQNAGTYDVILVDAYQDITIPFQMSTAEFFSQVKAHLKEGGVMAVNMNMRSGSEGSINEYLCDTIASVFGSAWTVPVENGTNLELFASDDPAALTRLRTGKTDSAELRAMMDRVAAALTPVTGGGHILTDDRAPVEVLGMRALDELIAGELSGVRDALKNGSIRELLG